MSPIFLTVIRAKNVSNEIACGTLYICYVQYTLHSFLTLAVLKIIKLEGCLGYVVSYILKHWAAFVPVRWRSLSCDTVFLYRATKLEILEAVTKRKHSSCYAIQ
jgi:hypothetical protein